MKLKGSDINLIEAYAQMPQEKGWHKLKAKYSFWYIDLSVDNQSIVRVYRYGIIGKIYKKFHQPKEFLGKIANVAIFKDVL